jgi:hypothetical protein
MSALGDWEVARLVEVEREIAERLRPVCPNTSEVEFDALVKRIARVRRKYEQRRHQELFHTPDDEDYVSTEVAAPPARPEQPE